MLRTVVSTIALPCAILSAAGLAAWTLASNPLAGIALATAAGGICIGAGAFAIAIRRDTDALRGAVGAIAGGDLPTSGDAHDLGLLAPVTPDLAALAERFHSAKEAATNDRLTHVANRPTLLAQLFQEVDRATTVGSTISASGVGPARWYEPRVVAPTPNPAKAARRSTGSCDAVAGSRQDGGERLLRSAIGSADGPHA